MQVTFHKSVEDIGERLWNDLDQGDNPFLSYAFLAAAERHGAVAPDLGWHPRHLALWDDGAASRLLLGVMPLYLRTHSFGDFSGDWNWAGVFERSGRRYYPKLVTGIPYTPATGARCLVRQGIERPPVVRALIEAAVRCTPEFGASSWQCLFVAPQSEEHAALKQCGLLLRRGCQFHWDNRSPQPYRDYEDFLLGFSSDKRKKVRRERRRVAESGLRLEILHGDGIDAALWRNIYPHYLSTFARFGNHAAFPLEFFLEVGVALGRRMVVFLAREGSRVVAAAICYRNGTTLYGRHWGAEADYHSLHFELCLHQGIEYCIQHGLSRFEPGAQGEHKISRGFSPAPTWSAFWIEDPDMRRMLAAYFAKERDAMATYQDEQQEHAPFKRLAVPGEDDGSS